jgi:hypothetical protein
MNSKHFFWPAADYARNAFEQEREREREREETVTCNKCDCFINLSSCVGRREKPRCRALALLGRRREKERVGGTLQRAKGHISEIFPELHRSERGEPRAAKLQAPRRGWRWTHPRVYNAHVVALPLPLSSLSTESGNRNATERRLQREREREREIFRGKTSLWRALRLATFEIPSRSRTCHPWLHSVSRQEARDVKCDCYRYMCLMDS